MRREFRCKDVQRHLPDYLEGDLATQAQAAIDAHRDGCPACDRDVRELEATVRLLLGLPEPETPPMVAANVMRRIRTGETRPGMLDRLRQTVMGVFEPSFVLPASAMAVAALVVVTVQGPFGLRGSAPADGSAIVDSQPAGIAALPDPGAGTAGRGPSWASRLAPAPRASLATSAYRSGPSEHSPFAEGLVAQLRPTAAPMPISRAPMPAPGWGSQGGATVHFGGGAPIMPVAGPPTLLDVFDAASLHSAARTGRDLAGSSGGVEVRDQWLAAGLDSPVEFSRFLASKSLAEQELWVERLSARAVDRGLLTELLATLEGSGDEVAGLLAEDFRAAARDREQRSAP